MPACRSSTGVAVIPETGSMLPHGNVELSTGSPRCVFQRTVPVDASSA
jgi:hypothetical protein